jgi:hypothetical protein
VRWVVAIVLSFAAFAALAAFAPSRAFADGDYDPAGADGLRADLERIITTEEATGWFLDRTHYESMHASVLQSTCRATPAARQLLADRLASERAVAGDARELYEAAGKKVTPAVDRALHLERMLAALLRASADTCPFWIEIERGYPGRQTDRNRITLHAETGGLLVLRYVPSSERFNVGFGPSFRVLAGLGFDHVTIMAGPEMSGAAMLRDDDSSKFIVRYFPAIPVVVRIRYVNWIYSVETGVVSLFEGGEPGINFGLRAGFGVGFMALRNRFFIPWAGISAYQEHYFGNDSRPAAEYFRGGLRVGIIYDP